METRLSVGVVVVWIQYRLRCRLPHQLIDDPDYDLVRYDYEWSVGGESIRSVTTAAIADAIPKSEAQPGDNLVCVVTPSDGTNSALPVTLSTVVRESPTYFAESHGFSSTDLPENDADADGLPLLIEYYLNTSPAALDKIPIPFEAENGEWVWSLTPHPLLAGSVSATVEHSRDLLNWSAATSDDGVIWRSGDVGQGPRFFRLSVTWESVTRVGVLRHSAEYSTR